MDLSILVVSWNTRDLLRSCLESIYQTIDALAFEVIVVDNGSSDGSPEMVARDFPAAKLIRNEENLGFARANNQAIRTSSGRNILLLNSDAVLRNRAAQCLARFLDTRPTVGAVGGKLLNPDGSFQGSFADFPGLLGETLLLTGLSRWLLPATYPSYPEEQSQEPRRVDWVSGALLAVRRSVVDAVGLLDEAYFMYTEEVDWCYRITRGGWEVFYLPDAQAIHWSGGSSRQASERKRSQLYRSKWLFMRKHRGWLRAALYRRLVQSVSALKLVAWSSSGLLATAAARERARQNVASYRFLLANF